MQLWGLVVCHDVYIGWWFVYMSVYIYVMTYTGIYRYISVYSCGAWWCVTMVGCIYIGIYIGTDIYRYISVYIGIQLWGLVVCHDANPRSVSYQV